MEQLDVKFLDTIIKNAVEAVEASKTQIFDIREAARNEMENVRRDVERVKQEAAEIIFYVDELAKRERRARIRLVEVHRNFQQHTEEDMKSAYQDAENFRVEMEVARERETNLRRQRDDLELRLRSLKNTVDKAEALTEQVGLALGFLGEQMGAALNHIESLQQRQLFGVKIIKAQEEERRRVARDIHDGPAQALANVVFRAEVCERLMDSDLARAKVELSDLREQVRAVLKDTRKMIFGLRPMTLDDLGLAPTIKRLLDVMRERTGVVGDLRISGQEQRFDSAIEIGLFRVVQETLTNVEKHAQASFVRVRIDFRQQAISLLIEDDGKGFDTSVSAGSDHFGLSGMEERIDLIGGEIKISSQLGKGTKVYIRVSLPERS
ncbi:MAG: degS [Anaerosporomusa subterranea]|jgi:two-component system sensor histidine kinase DegS|nr:degS [Anaerosporomusa subterranea]